MCSQYQNNDYDRNKRDGRIIAGLFLLVVGALFFMKELSFPFFPNWLFTWPMILITIGIYTGLKHQFRNPGWIIMVVIGGIFLIDDMNVGFDIHRFIVPIVIVSVGLIMIMRPRRDRGWGRSNWSDPQGEKKNDPLDSAQRPDYTSEDFFDSTAVFGSSKKVIISKDFKGGDITCFMGGCEIDFTQADIIKPAVIDMTLVFGGGKIIVPADWQVVIHITPVFGGVEDKRKKPVSINPDKVLILKGTCLFGGFEIKNY
jgi:predicted membrane protein